MGTSRATVRKNIHEFRNGPTYAKTKRKFGAAVARRQSIAVALKQKRKSRSSY